MSASDLVTQVKRKYSGTASRRLIELTNMTNDNNVTSINDDVLLYHCEDAIGYFEMETGHSADLTSIAKRKILVDIVIYLLMVSKGTDSSLIATMKKNVDGLVMSLRKKSRGKMTSSSVLRQSEEQQNSYPDMDRSLVAFNTKRSRRQNIREVNE